MPVERIGQLLTDSGYRQLKMPLEIGGITFAFRGAYVGTRPSPDLVLVADTAFDNDRDILRLVEGVCRALDIVGSIRPVTVVLAGPRPRTEILDALSKVSRVLPVGIPPDGSADATIHNWLAVLMPLQLPNPSQHIADPMGEISMHLVGIDPAVASLTTLAPAGVNAVRNKFHEILQATLANTEQAYDPT